jgi:predicted nucleotidyltransferase/HEPN domain-containing protein
MKTDITTLPQHKQDEIKKIVSVIQSTAPAEMVILFGSYARGDFVEAKHHDGRYRYQSDIDILVLVETRSEHAQEKYENAIEYQLDENADIKTPVSVIVHDIEFMNRRLRKAQYFFTDIKKEGVLLYDSQKFHLKEAKELSPQERKRLAQEDFNYYFEKADDFKDGVEFYFNKSKLNEAAFLLHQTAERLYTAILLVFTRYKPNTHDLAVLRKLSYSVSNKLLSVFPLDTPENLHLFKLLRKAYVDARYKPNYKITQDALSQLMQYTAELRETAQRLCLETLTVFNTV